MMIHRQLPIHQIGPWLVSGVSGCYIVARARQLSRARASRAPWLSFLAQQSDMILMLCGGPAVWHLVRRRYGQRPHSRATDGDHANLSAGVIHQLRQVFTVLLLGLGMVSRKAAEGKTAELVALARRLQQITRGGARLLSALDEPAPDLVPAAALSYPLYASGDGASHSQV